MKTLKYAVRFLMRSKSYTFINLLGLTLSLACCIILLRYIHREMTVDTHCVDREQVYTVIQEMEGDRRLATINNADADSMYVDNRYIDKRTSIILLEEDFVMHEQNRYPVRTLVADSCYFQLFPYSVLQGSQIDAPESALLTKAYARRLFGNENPIGKVLRHSSGKDFVIKGIIAEPANKTMIQFDLVLPQSFTRHWERMPIEFVRFMPGTDMRQMNEIGKQPRWVDPPPMEKYGYAAICLLVSSDCRRLLEG